MKTTESVDGMPRKEATTDRERLAELEWKLVDVMSDYIQKYAAAVRQEERERCAKRLHERWPGVKLYFPIDLGPSNTERFIQVDVTKVKEQAIVAIRNEGSE